MANFFSTAVGKALTGVVSKVAGGYSPIAGALVEGAAAYAESASLEKKAKAQAKKFAASLPKGISLSVADTRQVVAQKTLKQAKATGFVGSGPMKSLVPPNSSTALTKKLSPRFESASAALASLVPKPQVSKPNGIGLPDLWDALGVFRPKSAVQLPAEAPMPSQFPLMRRSGSFTDAQLERMGQGRFPLVGPMQERKRRTMNPTNIRALRRAARRMEGFLRIAKRFLRVERRVKFKKRKRPC